MALPVDTVKALKYLIKQTPAGEILDVIPHLATLCGDKDAMQQSSEVLETLRKWYEAHRYHITLPDGRKGLVTEVGYAGESVSDFIYYDSTQGLTFKFDPFSLEAELITDEKMDVPTTPLRDSLLPELTSYVNEAFRKDKALF